MSIVARQLAAVFSRTWWMLLLRGLIAILFGVLAWLLPAVSMAMLVLLFGIYVLVDGVLGVWAAIVGRGQDEHWWVLLLWGLVGIGVGIITLLAPGITAMALLFYIAIWAVATGVLQIIAAIRLRREISGEWLLILAGLASAVFGVLLMAQPSAGALALLWLIAAYAIVFGVIMVIVAFRARSFARRLAKL